MQNNVTPAEQLAAVQNPFELDLLRRENRAKFAHVFVDFIKALASGELDDKKCDELAPKANAGLAESELVEAEAAKPPVHRRHGMTLLRDETKIARAYALFDAKMPDRLVRDLWAHWGINTPPGGFVAQPPHLYRNQRHVLVSQKFVRAKYGATEIKPADLPQQNDPRP